jgi:hypothetical protein
MTKISWGKGSGFNLGRIEGTDYRCERYWLGSKDNKQHWYMLADNHLTYLCAKGPFSTPEERDQHIINEVEKRHESTNNR